MLYSDTVDCLPNTTPVTYLVLCSSAVLYRIMITSIDRITQPSDKDLSDHVIESSQIEDDFINIPKRTFNCKRPVTEPCM